VSPQRATRDRKKYTLGKQLANHASTRCSQCCSNRNFFAALGRARQHKIRDVGTRDQQNTSHGGQEHQQRRTGVANEAFFFRQHSGCKALAVVVWILPGQALGNDVHLRLSLIQTDSRLQPCNHVEHVLPSQGCRWLVSRCRFCIFPESGPQLRSP
jgi:hypothetical protein